MKPKISLYEIVETCDDINVLEHFLWKKGLLEKYEENIVPHRMRLEKVSELSIEEYVKNVNKVIAEYNQNCCKEAKELILKDETPGL